MHAALMDPFEELVRENALLRIERAAVALESLTWPLMPAEAAGKPYGFRVIASKVAPGLNHYFRYNHSTMEWERF